MFFLLRTTFWLTLVLVLIPLGSDRDSETTVTVDPISAYFAAQATVSDLTGFCGRNPQACETGGKALGAIGAQARDGARIVYEFLDERIADGDGSLATSLAGALPTEGTLFTGSTTAHVTSGTLQSGDLILPWQGTETTVSDTETEIGPVPRPKPRPGQKA